MDNTEKARELINKHLYLHGGDGLGITDGDVYRAVLDAVCEALTIPDVIKSLPDFKPCSDRFSFIEKYKDCANKELLDKIWQYGNEQWTNGYDQGKYNHGFD